MDLEKLLTALEDNTQTADVANALSTVKEELTDANMETVVKILDTKPIKSYIRYLVGVQVRSEQLNEGASVNLQNLIYILQSVYNYSGNVESPVSDYDYDRLYELMENYDTEMITTPIASTNAKIVHHRYKTLRGTLKKVYALSDEDKLANDSRRTLDQWIAECERIYETKTGQKISLNNEDVYVFPKWDGVSVVFEIGANGSLERALTRGDTESNEAQDITHIFAERSSDIRDESMLGKAYGLKTEVMVTEREKDSYNKKYGTKYKNTRSIASSIINTDVLDGRENLLEIVKLRTSILNEDGTEQLQELSEEAYKRPFLRCPLSDREAIRKFAYAHRSIGGLNCDGAVIYIINEEIRKVLGRVDNKNQYEVAYKFNEDVGYTKIKDIEFNVTRHGMIFPVALLKNVTLKGNDIKRVSLGSMGRMSSLGLRKGDTVKILYEIIPYLIMDDTDPKCNRSDNPVIKAPDHCPECGELLETTPDGIPFRCINPDCKCRQLGKILNFVEAMGIEGIGESTMKDLMDAGVVNEIPDLYNIGKSRDIIASMEGYTEASVARLVSAVESRKTVPAEVFMSAIGIESIGKKTFEKVLKNYSIDEVLALAKEGKISAFVSISGIGELQAKKIVDGVHQNRKLIKELLEKIQVTYPKNTDDAKFIAVFHKVRSRTLTMEIELMGGKVNDNLTKETTFLIVPNGFGDSTSATSDKARRYGIPIVELDNVHDYIAKLV